MKIWIDSTNPAPEGYAWCKTVNGAKEFIGKIEREQKYYQALSIKANRAGEKSAYFARLKLLPCQSIDVIDIGHDAGRYTKNGGEYIDLLRWFEETGRNYPIRLHGKSPTKIFDMRRIIEKNNWVEIL